jgi:hypothetical protein
MTRNATTRICLIVTMTGAALAGSAGIASAGSASGNCAGNMVNAHTWTADNTGGMATAMSVNNPNGDGVPGSTTGMWGAITHSC